MMAPRDTGKAGSTRAIATRSRAHGARCSRTSAAKARSSMSTRALSQDLALLAAVEMHDLVR
jgi:hypothetical protein